MWPASASSASEPVSKPPIASATMKPPVRHGRDQDARLVGRAVVVAVRPMARMIVASVAVAFVIMTRVIVMVVVMAVSATPGRRSHAKPHR